jgi:hypothetical protein
LYSNKIEYQGREANEAKKYFLIKPDNCVNNEDQAALELEITDEEIAIALKDLPTHKRPNRKNLMCVTVSNRHYKEANYQLNKREQS